MTSSETFHDHVKELRNRLFIVFLSVAIFSILGYVLRNNLLNFIHQPLNSPLYYNTPAGAFNLSFKISAVFGVFISIPVILYNIIRFVQPALFNTIKPKTILIILSASCTLAVMGAAFGFYILLPLSLHFFGGYSTKNISPLLSANEYYNYVLNMIIAFAILFQIPLIIDFINRIKPFKTKQLLKYQKHVIVASIIIAIILPFTFDPLTQFVVAVPIVALYYFSIAFVMFSNRLTSTQRARIRYSSIPPMANRSDRYIPVFKSDELNIKTHSVTNINKQPTKVRTMNKSRKNSSFIDGFRPVVRGI